VPDVGRLKPGYRADVVLYGENPLKHIESIRMPTLVMRDGVPQIPAALHAATEPPSDAGECPPLDRLRSLP
jgi:hypothetical protein